MSKSYSRRDSTNHDRTNRKRTKLSGATRRAIEPLERRALMCALHADWPAPTETRPDLVGVDAAGPDGGPAADIVWTNRATTTTGGAGDTDGFGSVFGANANVARGVVDAVIAAYEQMIISFNYSDGSANFNLNVSMGGGTGTGGAGGTNSLVGGKPKSGSLTLQTGNNGAGSGWYVDPTPNDHSEFNDTIINAYAGDAPPTHPVAFLGDLYTVAAAEVAHCLGLLTPIAAWDALTTDTNINDNDEGNNIADYYVFNGPSIQHLMTEFNAGTPSSFGGAVHTAGGFSNINFNGTNYIGAQDAGNARYETGRRYLVPDTLGLMFQDAYGYSVTPVGVRPNFYSLLNSATGELLIRGDDFLDINDTITISRTGSNYFVSVDLAADIPGTGALPGNGNLPAFTSFFTGSQVSTITIRGFGGNDVINIDGVFSGDTLTIEAGEGNDTINFTPTGDTLDLIGGTVNINGELGGDNIVFHDTANTFNDTYNLTSTTFNRNIVPTMTFGGIESMRLDAGSGNNTINVSSLASTMSLGVNAGDGTDILNVGGAGSGNVENVDGNINYAGQNGTDTLNYNDQSNTANGLSYTMTSLAVTRTGAANTTFFTTETINVNAGSGANTINVNSTANGSTTTVNANNGNDTINVGLSAAANLTLNGGIGNDTFSFNNVGSINPVVQVNGDAGTDTVNYNDQTNSGNESYNANATQVFRNLLTAVNYATVEAVVLNAGAGSSQINVPTSLAGMTITVNAGAGNDTLNITFPTGDLSNSPGAVVFNGEAGTDAAILWDDLSTANDNYTITSSTVAHPGFGGLTYATTESLTLNASDGNNIISVNSSAAGTPLVINGNDGNDTINIAQSGGNLNTIAASVAVNGGTGTDSVLLFDASSADNDPYTITTAAVTNAGFGGVSFSLIEALTLNAAGGNNVVDLNATAAGVPVIVNGGGGNDELRLAFASTRNLASIAAAVTYDGGAGVDAASLWDDFTATADTFAISSTAITQAGFGGFNFNGTVESVAVNASSGVNTFNVTSWTNDLLVLNANNGNDIFNIAAGDFDGQISGDISALGGGDSDSVFFHDTTDGLGSDIYTMQNDSLRKITSGTTSWTQVEAVTINGSNNADLYELISGGFASITVNAGNGNDQFGLGVVGTGNLDNLNGLLTLNGQVGSDSITMHDSGSSENDAYTITSTSVTHPGFGGLNYATVESLTLNAGSGSNEIEIASTLATTPLFVNAAGGNDQIDITEPTGNLQSAAGLITADGGAGSDLVRLFDEISTQNDGTTIGATSIVHASFGGLTYSALENVVINCSLGNNPIDIVSTAAGVTTTINAGSGNDTFNVTIFAGDLANAPGLIDFNGGAGSDTGTLHDSSSSGNHTYIATNADITRTGFGGFKYSDLEGITLSASSGDNVIDVHSTLANTPLNLNGNGGNDVFRLARATSNLNDLGGIVTTNGGAGSDSVSLLDGNSAENDDYTVTSTAVTTAGFGGLNYTTIEQLTLNATSGQNTITVNSTAAATPVALNANSGSDIINVFETAVTAPVTVVPSGGRDTVRVNADGTGAARVNFVETQSIGPLQIQPGGVATVAAGGDRVLTAETVSIVGSGVLNLTDNTMIVDYTGFSEIAALGALLSSGYAGGAWNGPGINSSVAAATPNRALGYGEATDIFSSFPATFAGQSVDNTAVLIRYTLPGDATLDRTVDIADFSALASNFNSPATRWSRGNFNYDNATDIADFSTLASNFNSAIGDVPRGMFSEAPIAVV